MSFTPEEQQGIVSLASLELQWEYLRIRGQGYDWCGPSRLNNFLMRALVAILGIHRAHNVPASRRDHISKLIENSVNDRIVLMPREEKLTFLDQQGGRYVLVRRNQPDDDPWEPVRPDSRENKFRSQSLTWAIASCRRWASVGIEHAQYAVWDGLLLRATYVVLRPTVRDVQLIHSSPEASIVEPPDDSNVHLCAYTRIPPQRLIDEIRGRWPHAEEFGGGQYWAFHSPLGKNYVQALLTPREEDIDLQMQSMSALTLGAVSG